ncbi:MAG: hypothetical protein JNK65_09400, partial [Deltaproteobacteria bacterium]|nr:hypothetical protein [Deltaproteobacteria bacterium]
SLAFFSPQISSILSRSPTRGFLNSGLMRGLGNVFALGFAADLLFTSIHSSLYGDQASALRQSYYYSSEQRDQEEGVGFFSLDHLFELVSPNLAAWFDRRDPAVVQPPLRHPARPTSQNSALDPGSSRGLLGRLSDSSL